MKKILMLAVALIGLTVGQAHAQIMPGNGAGIKPLNLTNYDFELASAPTAVVAYYLKTNVMDHNGQLITNLSQLAEFHSMNPFVRFYRVEGFSNPALVHELGLKTYPSIAIFRFGKLVKTVEDVFLLDDLFPLVQEAIDQN